MAGALALLVLLAISLTVVRAAGVALRLTGLPQDVARFQAISGLTGAGYTTSESESVMRHPTRRRILMLLMLAGHLGIVSFASTVILAVGSAEGTGRIAVQIIALLAVVAFVYALAASPALDRLMCDVIGRFMVRRNWIQAADKTELYADPGGLILCEHEARRATVVDPGATPVRFLALNGKLIDNTSSPIALAEGDAILCLGEGTDQEAFSEMLQVSPSPT